MIRFRKFCRFPEFSYFSSIYKLSGPGSLLFLENLKLHSIFQYQQVSHRLLYSIGAENICSPKFTSAHHEKVCLLPQLNQENSYAFSKMCMAWLKIQGCDTLKLSTGWRKRIFRSWRYRNQPSLQEVETMVAPPIRSFISTWIINYF